MQLLNHLKKRRANGRGWDERCGWKQPMRTGIALLALSIVFSLSGCGGGGSGSAGVNNLNVISGIVADGYINGATVCLDMNKNTVCDPTEPSTQTVAGGAFSLTLANPNDINLYPLVAEVPPTAIDEDTGKPVGKGYVLSAPSSPAGKAPFISPISTLVQAKIAQGVTPAQAVIDIKTGLGFPANSTVDITSNFMNSKTLLPADKQKLRTSAQVIARVFAANNDVVKATLKKAGIKNKTPQVNALVYKKASSQLGSIQQYASSGSTQAGPVQTVNIPSTISLSLNSSTFATDIALTSTQKNKFNQTLTGQGATIPTAPSQLTINPNNSCVMPPDSLGGLSYAVALTAGQRASYCFNVTEVKQDVIIKMTKGLNRVKFTLEKQDPVTLAFASVKGWTQHTYTRFSGATQTSPANATPLTKGFYKITFSEDRLFMDAAKTTATVNIYSNSISRLEKQVNLVTQNKFIVQPYALTLGSQTIKGSLNLVQDGIAKGLVKPTQVIEDVIPLQLSSPSMANVSINIQTGSGVQVLLMNAAYALSILDQTMIAPADWQIWQGTTAQLKNKTFHFVKSKNTADSYYLVLRRSSANSIFTYKASDDVPYTVTVTTSTVPAVTFTTGATPKAYQVGSYDKPVTAAKGMFGAATIATAVGKLPTVSPSEFLTNTQNAKNLTSAMQTFKSVMEFDESALMRFYVDYMDVVSGLGYANITNVVFDTVVTSYVQYKTKQVKAIPKTLYTAGALITSQWLLDQKLKTVATDYIAYSKSSLLEYNRKKKAFIDQTYRLGMPITADLIGSNPALQSKLMELFVLQSRASRFLKAGMDIYKASASTSTPLTWAVKRLINLSLALVPSEAADIIKFVANKMAFYGSVQALISAFKTKANVAKVLDTSWADLLNDSKYFSYYDSLVQANNLKILKNQGFVIDTVAPAVKPPANATILTQGAISVPASDSMIAAFLNGATATDKVGVVGGISNNAPANFKASFPPSPTTVTFSATDTAGNVGTATATVTVIAPAVVVTSPAPIILSSGQGVTSVPASDPVIASFLKGATALWRNALSLVVTNDAPTSFPTGITTTVIFTAKDAAGNTGTATATVTVKKAIAIKDTIPPAVTPPNPLLMTFSFAVTSIPKANSKITAFLAAATATDKVGVVGGVTNNAPANFPVGTTTVTFTAKDAAGNIGTATATVTIKAIAPTAALVDGFDYPLGNRGVNANGIPLPFLEQITPEINSNYTNKTVTVKDYGRFAINANAAKWRNAQDVGSFNSAQGGVHPGEDWNLGAGDNDKGQPVYAVANGTVIAVRSTYRSGYLLGGWTMVLEHALSNGSKLYSFYAHVTDSKETLGILTTSAAKFSLKVGDIVTRGQMIARLAAGSKTVGGMTNFTSHLHLEMRTIKPILTIASGLWEGDNGLGYYTHLTPTVPRRANTIRRPVTMTAAQINTAYARMQTSLGIVDPSDYIDAHRAGLVGKVTSISPQTVVSGIPTLFTITGTSLPSTLAASLQGSLKGSCGAVTVNTAGTSATITCTPGALNAGASFYIKNVTGGLILPSSVAFTVTVNATAPVKDTTPPVITLTGAAKVSVSQGQNYVDLGATAFDVVDGYVTALKTSTVNTSAIGTYTVTYNASDLSGNAAIPVVRTVNVVAGTNPVVTTLNNGLVAYYPFDGYATDASGNGNNGTVFGGVTYPVGVKGKAASFHNVNNTSFFTVNDYIQLPNITLNNSFAFTYSVLFRSDAHVHNASIYSVGDNSNGYFFAHFVDQLGHSSFDFASNSVYIANVPLVLNLSDKAWHQIIVNVNNNLIEIYDKGVFIGSAILNQNMVFQNAPNYLALNQWYNGTAMSSRFNGMVDDLRIYNRFLTATELSALTAGNSVNQAPVPTAPAITSTGGVASTSQIAANDPNVADTHTYAVSTAAINGTALVDAVGLVTYTPNAGYVGADSFVVTVTDGRGLAGLLTINITVN